jgi:hypothetical protein
VNKSSCRPEIFSESLSAGEKDKSKPSLQDAESLTPAGNPSEHVMCHRCREHFKEAASVWGSTRVGDLT